jgi:hypothetical protein
MPMLNVNFIKSGPFLRHQTPTFSSQPILILIDDFLEYLHKMGTYIMFLEQSIYKTFNFWPLKFSIRAAECNCQVSSAKLLH